MHSLRVDQDWALREVPPRVLALTHPQAQGGFQEEESRTVGDSQEATGRQEAEEEINFAEQNRNGKKMAVAAAAVVGAGFFAGFVCGQLVHFPVPSHPSPLPPPPPPPPLPPPPSRKKNPQQLLRLVRDEYLPAPAQAPAQQPPKKISNRKRYSRTEITKTLESLRKAPPAKSAEEKSASFADPPLFVEIRSRKRRVYD